MSEAQPLEPVAVLHRIAFLLEAKGEPAYRVRAFRRSAASLAALPAGDIVARARYGRLKEIEGVGDVTERIVQETLTGEPVPYLERLEDESAATPEPQIAALL